MSSRTGWTEVPYDQAFRDVTAGNQRVDQADYLESGALAVVDQGQAHIAGYTSDLSLACSVSLPCLVFGDHTKIVKYVDHPFAIGAQGVRVLVPTPGLDVRFAFYALSRVRLPADAGYSRHSRFLKRARIAYPSIPEQRRIAAMLDTADAIRRKRQESLTLLDEFLRSAFLEMFGDPVSRSGKLKLESGWQLLTVEGIQAGIENACAGGPFGSSLTRSDYVPEPGVPVIRGNNLVADLGVFVDENFVFVTEAKAEELKRNIALPGDVVFTQRGTVGQVARIPSSARYPRYVISQSQMKLTVNEELVDPTYLVQYFLSPRARSELTSRTLATGVPHINLAILRSFPVVVPPLLLQKRFAGVLAQNILAQRRLQAAGDAAGQLFNSLADWAFRGEL